MSLEEAIRENTEAIKQQTALMEKLAKSGGTAAGDGEGKAPPKKAPPKKAPPKKVSAPTEEDLRAKFGGYLSSETTKAGKKALTGTVKPILEHFGVDRVTEIPEENREEAMGYCDLLIAGYEEDGVEGAEGVHLPFMEEDDGGEDDDGDLL